MSEPNEEKENVQICTTTEQEKDEALFVKWVLRFLFASTSLLLLIVTFLCEAFLPLYFTLASIIVFGLVTFAGAFFEEKYGIKKNQKLNVRINIKNLSDFLLCTCSGDVFFNSNLSMCSGVLN